MYELPLIEDPVTDQVWQRVSESLSQFIGIDSIPEAPMCFTRGSSEDTVSEFVKALLLSLLFSKQMYMQTLNIPGLPTCMCDMTIIDTDGTPVGVVVVTAPGKQIQNSVVQCAMHLVAIHALHIRYDLFGIITDYRTYLSSSFRHKMEDFLMEPSPRVHAWQSLDELRKICGLINRFLNFVKP